MKYHILWLFLQTIRASIMTKNKASVGRLLVYQFKLDMMVPKRAKEAPKTSVGLQVSLPFAIQ